MGEDYDPQLPEYCLVPVDANNLHGCQLRKSCQKTVLNFAPEPLTMTDEMLTVHMKEQWQLFNLQGGKIRIINFKEQKSCY